MEIRGISIKEYRKSQLLKWDDRVWSKEKAGEGSGNGESDGAEREADNRAVGSKASATANSIGAEKNRNDIIMVTKKKTVLNPLKAFLLLSSFKNPMIVCCGVPEVRVDLEL